ncbi:MAG TPA: substrate-binding domain-containing protein [Candidatus Dormibacteraeota bacterium]|nr:substrate-binding domain-containing protein [Candidatus Dormibacteraeota bacterium]
MRQLRSLTLIACVGAIAIIVAACGTSTSSTTGSNTVPNVTVASFTSDINATMSQFKSLTGFATKGANTLQVGVILPDTTSSTRYVDFDAPYLTAAFADAGYSQTQFRVDNAHGSDQTELNDAVADINLGAKVLVVDPIDNPTGIAIAKLAASKGVILIAYDRAIFQGTSTYYVSFDNQQVGNLIGTGFQQCVKDWGVSSPKVFTLDGGEDTDSNSIAFATGYNKAVWGQAAKSVPAGTTNSAGMTLVGEQYAPGWDNTKGGQIFQQAFTANRQINATIEANDGLAGAVITDLKGAGVKAKTIPTVGQDATAQGMAYVLQNWQCGSVYKAIYKEAQDSVALATILLAGDTPPTGLLNGKTINPADTTVTEPASLSVPVWVTAANMESTVVADGFDPASTICSIAGADVCSANNIK